MFQNAQKNLNLEVCNVCDRRWFDSQNEVVGLCITCHKFVHSQVLFSILLRITMVEIHEQCENK